MATYYKTNPVNKKDIKTTISYKTDNNNIYDIYKSAKTGKYYIVDKNGKQSFFTTAAAINAIENNSNMTIWKNGAGGYANNKSSTKTSNASSTSSSGGSSGGGGGGGYYYSTDAEDRYESGLKEYVKDAIDALVNPKVWTAEELAKHYGVEDQYNIDYLTKMYTDATNKYYNDAIQKQLEYNKDANISNSAYANSLLRSYLNSYKNAAPTAMGKGTRAANALTAMIGADMSNETSSSNLENIINDYRELQKAELENVAVKAREDYESKGQWLLNQGVNTNTAEVQNYINSLAAYTKAYEGIRNAQVNLASTAASQYQQAAQAALAQNQYNASRASENFLKQVYRNYYQNYQGNIDNAWEKAYNNVKMGMDTYNASGNSIY